MKRIKMSIKIALVAKEYLQQNAHTYEISKGKMLKDNLPADLEAFLKTG